MLKRIRQLFGRSREVGGNVVEHSAPVLPPQTTIIIHNHYYPAPKRWYNTLAGQLIVGIIASILAGLAAQAYQARKAADKTPAKTEKPKSASPTHVQAAPPAATKKGRSPKAPAQ